MNGKLGRGWGDGRKGADWSSAVNQPILAASITVEIPSPAKSVGKCWRCTARGSDVADSGSIGRECECVITPPDHGVL